jgi:hypothetical protein
MREPFAHDAELAWEAGDRRAPGGAVTEELCGSLDHAPPCPLAAHHTSVVRRDGMLEVRVLFACEPADEPAVRERIDEALGRGSHVSPDGVTSHWLLVSSSAGVVREDEAEHAARLVTS